MMISNSDNLWTKCPGCNRMLYRTDLTEALFVCPQCQHHIRLNAWERINITVDSGTFSETESNLFSSDPLGFPEYQVKLERDMGKTGLSDPIVTGLGQIKGITVVLSVSDFNFLGGSMGSVHGEKIVRAAELAKAKHYPFILFTASGGARMQEGLIALMQMCKTAAAFARFNQEKLPTIVVLTDPTAGGVLASYASLGDFIYSEPGALSCFAGARVAKQVSSNKDIPPDYQKASFWLERGQIDAIVPRREIRNTLVRTLEFCGFQKENKSYARP